MGALSHSYVGSTSVLPDNNIRRQVVLKISRNVKNFCYQDKKADGKSLSIAHISYLFNRKYYEERTLTRLKFNK